MWLGFLVWEKSQPQDCSSASQEANMLQSFMWSLCQSKHLGPSQNHTHLKHSTAGKPAGKIQRVLKNSARFFFSPGIKEIFCGYWIALKYAMLVSLLEYPHTWRKLMVQNARCMIIQFCFSLFSLPDSFISHPWPRFEREQKISF